VLIGPLLPISNKATWTEALSVTDGETGEAIDLSSADEITITVRDTNSRPSDYCFGTNPTPVLTATLTGGQVVLVETGVLEWTFTKDQMRALAAKTYQVGLTLEDDGEVVQLIIGTVPVLEGIVT